MTQRLRSGRGASYIRDKSEHTMVLELSYLCDSSCSQCLRGFLLFLLLLSRYMKFDNHFQNSQDKRMIFKIELNSFHFRYNSLNHLIVV